MKTKPETLKNPDTAIVYALARLMALTTTVAKTSPELRDPMAELYCDIGALLIVGFKLDHKVVSEAVAMIMNKHNDKGTN